MKVCILDINARYQITEQDTAFGISNLHFDLSVYDVFGILGAGGKLVLPDPEYGKDPAHWIHWLNHENITVWNSVPAFVEMLAEYEEYQRQVTSQSLRLVMMSGDWVPVLLPGRIRNLFQNVEIVALGGATEGSIWSNHFEIPEVVPEDWKSIPYGKPLANQKYYVLDQNMEDCPDWVPGTLYIAGDGIAQGYLNDKEKTKEKFVVLDRTGERLYCTGDMGRYWNDGNIEFLGRLDNQVKINGYRVELGEIETFMNWIHGVKISQVVNIKDNKLVGFYVSNYEINETYFQNYLRDYLPKYMIPQNFIALLEMPTTKNGKIDKKELKRKAIEFQKTFESNNRAMTKEEKEFSEIWKEVLKCQDVSLKDDFFSSGGNSLKAITLANRIKEKYIIEITIRDVLEFPIVEQLSEFVQKKVKDNSKKSGSNIEEGFF